MAASRQDLSPGGRQELGFAADDRARRFVGDTQVVGDCKVLYHECFLDGLSFSSAFHCMKQ